MSAHEQWLAIEAELERDAAASRQARRDIFEQQTQYAAVGGEARQQTLARREQGLPSAGEELVMSQAEALSQPVLPIVR